MRKNIKLFCLFLLLPIFLSAGCFLSLAEQKTGDIISFRKQKDHIYVFLANPEKSDNYEISCQIGSKEAKVTESVPVTDSSCEIETIVLIDNSISIREEYRRFFSDFVSEMVDQRADNETFTVAVFSERINVLLNKSNTNAEIKETVANIEYCDQETYLTDILYELFSSFSGSEGSSFRRLIVVSDGVDSKEIGVTKGELDSVITDNPCLIFTLGCTSYGNNEELKEMFALSRKTGGTGFLLDEIKEPAEVANNIRISDNTIRVTIQPSPEDMDGTTKAVCIRMDSRGVTDNSFQTRMPFASPEVEKKENEEPVPESSGMDALITQSIENTSEENDVKQAEGNASRGEVPVIVIVAVAVLVLIVIVAVELIASAKKKNQISYDTEDEQRTERISDDDTPTERLDDERTMILVNSSVTLIDEDHPGRKYNAELSDQVTVGRSAECDLMINDDSVSRKHCVLYKQGSKVFIRNLSQMNGTIVNGNKISDTCEIINGTKLKLGRVSLRVELSD